MAPIDMESAPEVFADVTPAQRDNRRVVAGVVLALCAVAGVSYSAMPAVAGAQAAELDLTITTSGIPTVHAYVDAL